MIARRDWQALGGFDPAFFIYGEEADLCLRPLVTDTATIVHLGCASEKIRPDKMVRLLRAKVALVHQPFPVWRRPPARQMFRFLAAVAQVVLYVRRSCALVRPGAIPSHAVWAVIGARRHEWRRGFPPSLPDPTARPN